MVSDEGQDPWTDPWITTIVSASDISDGLETGGDHG